MTLMSKYKISWYKGKYILANDRIKCIDISEEVEVSVDFNPDNPIFMEFISLNTKEPASFVRFCNKYGRLGINDKMCMEESWSPLEDCISWYEYEIDMINATLSLNQAIHENDKFNMIQYSFYLCDNFHYEIGDAWESLYGLKRKITGEHEGNLLDGYSEEYLAEKLDDISMDYVKHIACQVMKLSINPHVSGVAQFLDISDNYEFIGGWGAFSLLSCMYMEIFLLITDGTTIRKCANKSCNNYFRLSGNDTRKIYCSTRCAQLQAKRKQRARDKQKQKDGE